MLSRTARHLAPMRTLASRRSVSGRLNPPSIQQLQRPCARFSSSSPQGQQPPTSSQEPSANAQFYRTFGRPIFKVFLLAIFTYQLAYYFWVRLEQDEIKSEMRATIADLEARIEQLEKARKK
ncbi:hypothetical protein GGS26DRAFT_21978 [Hypomontagnella submonticulosa]|nr:hypothetical protein GGS26DRAFT_21978 [Hypomontagnella submonticulosa]